MDERPEIVQDIDAAWRFCGSIFRWAVVVVAVMLLLSLLR
jgi:hypothetical protein